MPAHPYVVRALAEHGVDATGWGATRLDPALVEASDLVLTAAAEQREEVVALSPDAAGRTFTLLDFSAWLQAAPATAASDPDGARAPRPGGRRPGAAARRPRTGPARPHGPEPAALPAVPASRRGRAAPFLDG